MANETEIDVREFRNALGSFTTGVTIATTRDRADHDVGLTVNSFNSVSLDPPLVLWSLAKSSHSLKAFVEAEFFAVHILAASQESLSNLFSKRGADKFAALHVKRGHGGVPLLDGCAARFECRTAFRYAGGDHEILVGEVLTFEHFDRLPLVFQKGGYALAVRKPQTHAPAPAPEISEPESSFSKDFLVYLLGCAHSMLMSKIRPTLERHGLCDDEYYVLSILGVDDNRTVVELDALTRYAGRRVSPDLVLALARRGFVAYDVAAAERGCVRLTDQGRRAIVELVAVSKAVEEDALQQIDYSESHMLKHLLKRVIRNTAQDIPQLWKAR
jgi:flavin reductase (DIM6/NTAB) family NADH-FMN oxidoreductase RutF/DNA-binding MarR family transcriptional regulator